MSDRKSLIMDDDRFQRAVGALRSWGAVAVVGAGASVGAGFPLSVHLPQLVWRAVDADPDALAELSDALKRGGKAKAIVGDDAGDVHAALTVVSARRAAWRAFQRGFAELDRDRSVGHSAVHDALARLLHRRVVERVVSLNWDTRVERAYRHRYGRSLQADGGWLAKPHGDAAAPDQRWVYPHEGGYIPDTLVEGLRSLAEGRPRVLLLVGYGEGDGAVVDRLIAPLEERWRVIRIGPDATGEWDLPYTAGVALPALARAVLGDADDVPGWEHVGFDDQRGIGAALGGLKLGPSDVEACPRLPEVDRLVQSLDTVGSAVCVGQPGQGKSITVYQAAHVMAERGWEVVRLVEPGRSAVELAGALGGLPWRTVAVIDDAQAAAPRTVEALVRQAGDDLRVIVATNGDVGWYGGAVRIAGRRAVGAIAEALADRRDEVLSAVAALDSRVGDRYLDEPLERRIASAARYAEQRGGSPWLFCFTLTGGWNRAKDEVAAARDDDRADLLLAVVAARQVALADGDVDAAWVRRAARVVGRDDLWADRAVETLVARRVLVRARSGLRCPHVRYAQTALRVVFSDRTDEAWKPLCLLLREAVGHGEPPLQGVDWLLFDVEYANGFRWGQEEAQRAVIDDATLRALQRRCWAVEGTERGAAGFVLRTLLRWRRDAQLADIEAHAETLARWVETAEASATYGIGWLLNDTSNASRDLARSVQRRVNPAVLAERLSTVPLADGYAWGRLVAGFWDTGGEWADAFRSALDAGRLMERAGAARGDDALGVTDLANGVNAFDRRLALRMVRAAASEIGRAISEAPLDRFTRAERELVSVVLGMGPGFLRRRPPNKRQLDVARRIVQAIDPVAVGQAISAAPRRRWRDASDLLLFLSEAEPESYGEVVAQIDLDRMDQTSEGLWERGHELNNILGALSNREGAEPARGWMARHADEIETPTAWLAMINPEVIADVVRRGHPLDLMLGQGPRWGVAAGGLAHLAEVDVDLAADAVRQHVGKITKGFAFPQTSHFHDGVRAFVHVMGKLAPEALAEAVTDLDPEVIEANWAHWLRSGGEARRAVAAVLDVATKNPGPVGDVARRLRQRFPRSSLPVDWLEEH